MPDNWLFVISTHSTRTARRNFPFAFVSLTVAIVIDSVDKRPKSVVLKSSRISVGRDGGDYRFKSNI